MKKFLTALLMIAMFSGVAISASQQAQATSGAEGYSPLADTAWQDAPSDDGGGTDEPPPCDQMEGDTCIDSQPTLED